MKIHEIDLIYSKCPRNSEIRSILAQSEIGFTKLINVGLFDFSCKVKCQKDLLNIFNFRQHPSDKFHYVIQILIIQKSPTQGNFSCLCVGGSDFFGFRGTFNLAKIASPNFNPRVIKPQKDLHPISVHVNPNPWKSQIKMPSNEWPMMADIHFPDRYVHMIEVSMRNWVPSQTLYTLPISNGLFWSTVGHFWRTYFLRISQF